MGLLNDYKTDKDLEKTGVWDDLGDIQVRLRRAGGRNTAFIKEQTRVTKPHRKAILRGKGNEELLLKAMAPVYAKCVLVDWKNVLVAVKGPGDIAFLDLLGIAHDGVKSEPYEVAIPYSVGVAEKVLQELPDFYEDVRLRSGDMALFQGDETEAAAGNSERS